MQLQSLLGGKLPFLYQWHLLESGQCPGLYPEWHIYNAGCEVLRGKIEQCKLFHV